MDLLRTILDELEDGKLPDDGGTDDPQPMPTTDAELLVSVRVAIGNYASALRVYRWVRRNKPFELDLPLCPRVMVEKLSGFSEDPVLGESIAKAIVQRVGELVDQPSRTSETND